MNFNITTSIEILERTPGTLFALLHGINEEWTSNNEGPGTWSPYDIVGHLIHGELTDWIPRAVMILSNHENKTFNAFNRFAQFDESSGKSLHELLDEFKTLRNKNIEHLKSLNITAMDLQSTGIHPAFGKVTMAQLLATWVVHDLNHIAQISRVMAKQYKEAVGPWTAYLRILQS
jgi:hypothetical protein